MSINSIKRARFDYIKERKEDEKYINMQNGVYKEISSSLAMLVYFSVQTIFERI